MRFLKICILAIIALPVTVLAVLIIYASVTNYQPEPVVLIDRSDHPDTIADSSVFDLVIWNIGYGGLDRSMDFFYDGGEQVRTSEEQLHVNMENITSMLTTLDSIEFILLQEVDVKSHRSYGINEVNKLSESFSSFNSYYGKNYDVFFVPLPVRNPLGSVNSGLLSFSGFKPSVVNRYTYPGQYAWPKNLFMLDRCFLVMRFPVANSKELLVINTHNTAYDDGSIRDQQMAFLREFILVEYQKGNYVITGGDWNQCPPGFVGSFSSDPFDTVNNKAIESTYLPDDWQWIYDKTQPTNRRVDIPYSRGTTLTTLIDFYLMSPNINVLHCETINLGFENSDHHPVYLKVMINN